MKKCVNVVRASKYLIGLNGATIYFYDLEENLIKAAKDIKSAYYGYVSKDEKVLCVKSSDTYMAFYDLETLELIKKITFKKCCQPQNQQGAFDNNRNFVNLQYTDRLTCDLTIYSHNEYDEIQRYVYNMGVVLESIDIIGEDIFIVGYIRPNKENFYFADIKKYIFKCENGELKGFEITEKDYFVYSLLRRFVYSLDREKDIEYMKAEYDFTMDEIKQADFSDLSVLWNKYNSSEKIIIEKPIEV